MSLLERTSVRRRATLIIVAYYFLIPRALHAQGSLTIGPNVQVSKARENFPHGEVQLAADAKDPNRLLGCSMINSEKGNRGWTITYASSDGGNSWTPTLETSAFDVSFDPSCAFGTHGAAYFLAEAHPEPGKMALALFGSTDYGNSWSVPTMIPNQFRWIDRNYVVADATGTKHGGRVYIHGFGNALPMDNDTREFSGINLFNSDDAGMHFAGPVIRLSASGHEIAAMGNSVILSDGTWVSLFGEMKNLLLDEARIPIGLHESKPDEPNALLKVVSSKDGGETLTPAVTVSDFYLDWPSTFTSVIPYLAADPGSSHFRDRLYSVWPDRRSGRLEILLAYSTDEGKTWSSPGTVNDDHAFPAGEAGPDDCMPVVAVNKDGVVGVSWHDRRNNPDNRGWFVRFTASLDGGLTWLPSAQVSEAPSSFGKDVFPQVIAIEDDHLVGQPIGKLGIYLDSFHFTGGDTGGLAADAAGRFHPFWIDNRTGIPQVWTAAVTVRGLTYTNGSPELDDLVDLSDRVRVEMTETSYDRTKHVATLSVRIKNISAQTIIGPLKLRPTSLQSGLGTVEIANSDNGQMGAGAIWNFSATLENNKLSPGETSTGKTLIFRLSDLRPLTEGKIFHNLMVTFEPHLFGKLSE